MPANGKKNINMMTDTKFTKDRFKVKSKISRYAAHFNLSSMRMELPPQVGSGFSGDLTNINKS